MSVIAQIVVESRRYSGWIDPRYPIGYWQAATTTIGDATGGVIGIDLVFQLGTTPRLNSQMYSVERVGITIGDNNDRDIQLRAVNMGGPSNQGFQHVYSVTTASQQGSSISGLRADTLDMIPWFLGSQRLAGITASLSSLIINVDGLTFTLEAEGYRWSTRSVLIDGGPQRPPTGPYRS